MHASDRLRCVTLATLLALSGCRGAPSSREARPPAGVPLAPPTVEAPAGSDERGEVPVTALGAGAGRVDRALRRYARDHAGRLPTSLAGLLGETDPDGAPYLRDLPGDAWGRPLAYAVLSARYGVYELRSYGPDGVPATGDDLVSKPEPVPFD